MKKILSVAFAFLLLVSGMHVSIATHICGGEVAAVKWSFSGEKGSCGMEDLQKTPTKEPAISSNCCQDKMAEYTVDSNYNVLQIDHPKVFRTISQVFCLPVNLTFDSTSRNTFYTHIFPPGRWQVSAVNLPDICVFRI
ncbi:MAG: hypothetical protein PHS30_02180 [Bacteroidales bacterium]|nr:hypothetical protein [Bacteroidales bacterium]